MQMGAIVYGAESLMQTLVANGVDVCFANPGTSEMHFVAALDRTDGMRGVLGLFEGTVTGAADGYARMTRRPAATLLHLGPGMANGLSGLHNALRAQSPIVNVIGDHAVYHRHLDAPLTSDIEGAARPFSDWVRTTPDAASVGEDTAVAVRESLRAPGQIATLVLPADAAWGDVPEGQAIPTIERPTAATADDDAIGAAVAALRDSSSAALLLGPGATIGDALESAGRIAAATGCRLLSPTMNARITRGAGRVPVERIPYVVNAARAFLEKIDTLVLVGAKAPVGFFAYPDRPSLMYAPGTRIIELARSTQDLPGSLAALADAVGGGAEVRRSELTLPDRPTSGSITVDALGAFVGAIIPDDAIIVDESVTSGRAFVPMTENARPHDWLLGTGGAIGYAMPCAVGAAIACPDRKVIALESDGSAMYQPQALWTMARENLDVLVLIFANRAYRILQGEMRNVGVHDFGPKASALLDIDNPTLDFVALATSMGVQAARVDTFEGLNAEVDDALAHRGPRLIEIVL